MNDRKTVSDEALQTLAHWVSAIADNIQNPLAGIAAALDIVERRLEANVAQDPLVAGAMHRIRERLGSVAEYVAELVSFSRPIEMVARRIATQELIAQVVASVSPRFPAGARVSVEVSLGAETMTVDVQKLHTALKALIVNAVEAAPVECSANVAVSATVRNGSIELAVEDNGPGISDALKSRALEPFFSTKEAGTGLGLAIARKYAEVHGGSLTIDSSARMGGAKVALKIPHQDVSRSHRS